MRCDYVMMVIQKADYDFNRKDLLKAYNLLIKF